MLSNHLGVKVFLQGVSDYLKAHAYGKRVAILAGSDPNICRERNHERSLVCLEQGVRH
jgi:hypothetical protein